MRVRKVRVRQSQAQRTQNSTLLAIGLEPGEVLQVAGEDRETDVRLDEEGVLDKDHVPVASPVQGSPNPSSEFSHDPGLPCLASPHPPPSPSP